MSYEGKQQEATAKSRDEAEVSSFLIHEKQQGVHLPKLRTSSQHYSIQTYPAGMK